MTPRETIAWGLIAILFVLSALFGFRHAAKTEGEHDGWKFLAMGCGILAIIGSALCVKFL